MPGTMAAETPLFAAPSDFWVGSNGRKDPLNGGLLLYGPTDPKASWYIAQWNNPGRDLPDFQRQSGSGDTTVYLSKSDAASVEVEKRGDSTTVTMSQDNANMPCKLASGGPGEFDLLVGMNHPWVNRARPDASSIDPHPGVTDRLSNMRVLQQQVTVAQVREWSPYATPRCPNNQGNLMVAVVLRDDSVAPPQALYYQLALRTICHVGSTYKQCQAREHKSSFWWQGRPVSGPGGKTVRNFGYRDTLSTFGIEMVGSEASRVISIDLLPPISNLLDSGEYGIDQNLSHWRVMSAYYGQNIWGDVGLASRWSGYRLTAVSTKNPK